MQLHSKDRILTSPKRTLVVGVINVTPDSFVQDSRTQTPSDITARARELMEGGADILEVGGESTGPHSTDVSLESERGRVLPAVTLLRRTFPDAWISVDTYKSGIAHDAIAAGADMINDVTAGRGDERMFAVAAEQSVPIVLMYAKDQTARTTDAPTQYDDVVLTVREFLQGRLELAKSAGIRDIILDPGLGHFVSSDPAYSWEILTRLSHFTDLGPILVSPSRKSFLAGPTHTPVAERLPATIAANCLASVNGASFIRTHDVRRTREALDAISHIAG